MKPILQILALGLSLVVFSGCARFVESEVAVFHQLGETPIPRTYALVPLNVEDNSPGYKSYAALIRQKLRNYQFREVAAEDNPDVVIAFGYGIDSGRKEMVSIPISGQPEASTSITHGIFCTYRNCETFFGAANRKPIYGIVGGTKIEVTQYSRHLWLQIADANSMSTEKLKFIYEGNVKSYGSSSQLSKVIPAMIEALFKSFPGKSGETRTETISIQ